MSSEDHPQNEQNGVDLNSVETTNESCAVVLNDDVTNGRKEHNDDDVDEKVDVEGDTSALLYGVTEVPPAGILFTIAIQVRGMNLISVCVCYVFVIFAN